MAKLYTKPEQYLAYCRNTNEKALLHNAIYNNFSHQDPVHILDIGSGNGINTVYLADRFPNTLIDAIENSEEQIKLGMQTRDRWNINYLQIPFEKLRTQRKYDFVLASHVLQYIDTDVSAFVEKAASMLELNGDLWIVQQTRIGMYQIINHQRPFLQDPRFKDWKTFEDYEPIVRDTLDGGNYNIDIDYLGSSFKEINFKDPSEEDKLRLEFILCLDKPFDQQTPEFKEHLAKLELGSNGRIRHPNGILKIRRI